MNALSTSLICLGNVSSKLRDFLQDLTKENALSIEFYPNLKEFNLNTTQTRHPIVIVEQNDGALEIIKQLRESQASAYLFWLGNQFSKEELEFGFHHRVYAFHENYLSSGEEIIEEVNRISSRIEDEKKFHLLLRSLKAMLLQVDGDIAESLFSEIKASVGKLSFLVQPDEFRLGARGEKHVQQEDLLFHSEEDLQEAILSIHLSERMGILLVQSEGKQGEIHFEHGQLRHAMVGEVTGPKAIYRMFLWNNPTFVFSRRELSEITIDLGLSLSVREACGQGVEMRTRFLKIENEIPPLDLKLELYQGSLRTDSKLPQSMFLTLCSVVEFGQMREILDLNPQPDVTLFENLIDLRRQKLIRVCS